MTRSKLRFCMVDTQDGLGELIQNIVSVDGVVLYLGTQGTKAGIIMIRLYPDDDRVYIFDLKTLGSGVFEKRSNFCMAQLRATTTGWYPDSESEPNYANHQRESLEVGRLPSLRDILESPVITKVVFDSWGVAAALFRHHGIRLCGVCDIQLMELAGRLPLLAGQLFHRKNVHRVEPRDLRTCLE